MATPTTSTGASNKLLLAIIAIFLPPLAVALKEGLTGTFWLNLVLTLIFFIPGIIHALLVVL
ncbi:YqaE/Pmp3 family membrane protein [Haloferula sargassicola]|uniref:YqaE/Pmp3 family membrane protein n=1 Tax=Haloferula sargassicola TaxID=490096 RepID=A0ABP9UIM7_9BACT